MRILDKWFGDMPQQFLGKKNIEVLIKAFSRQMEELLTVYEELNTLTDLDEAQGRNLDMVGDIACLSRKEATSILLKSRDTEISDDTYRQTLRYNVLKNNCECTFDDIIQAINLLWKDNNIVYEEDPELPATICLNMPTADLDGDDPAVNRILSIKPAGVALLYFITYVTSFYNPIKHETSIEMFIDWGDRYNKRFLDATWLLDGSVLLSGTLGESPDFNPVKNIVVAFENTNEITGDMQPESYVISNEVENTADIGCIDISSENGTELGHELSELFFISAENLIGSAGTATNELYLDGEWLLEGSISLKGGTENI